MSDELRAFIDDHSGAGTSYPTPGDFVQAILQHKKNAIDAANLRQSIVAAYRELQSKNKSA